MKLRRVFLKSVAGLVCLGAANSLFADAPVCIPLWWQSGSPPAVPAGPSDDFAAVTVGQFRYFAIKAMDHVNTGSGITPNTLGDEMMDMRDTLADLTGNDDFGLVNLGQVKAALAPMFDRLAEMGYYPKQSGNTVYPWPSSGEDHAVVNIGQLKHLLYIDITEPGQGYLAANAIGLSLSELKALGLYMSDFTGHTGSTQKTYTDYYNARANAMTALNKAAAIRLLNQGTFGACHTELSPDSVSGTSPLVTNGVSGTPPTLNLKTWLEYQKERSVTPTKLARDEETDFRSEPVADSATGSPPNPVPQSGLDSLWTTAIAGTSWRPDTVNGIKSFHIINPIGNGWWIRTDTATSYSRFLNTAVSGKDQLRQRMAFALSQILVVSFEDADLSSFQHDWGLAAAVDNYYDYLLEHGFGNYRELLEDVTKNPVMGYYLDLKGSKESANVVGTGDTTANENYARELMQLFTMGTDRLNWDGSPAGGQAYHPTNDVRAVARALTGWDWVYDSGLSSEQQFYARSQREKAKGQMEPVSPASNHVTPAASEFVELDFPAVTPASPQTTTSTDNDLKRVLDTICDTPGSGLGFSSDEVAARKRFLSGRNTAVFVSKQLIQFLVTSNPTPEYVNRVAHVFYEKRNAGDQLYQVARAILLDPQARALDNPSDPHISPAEEMSTDAQNRFGLVREPIIKMTHAIRAMNGAALSDPATIANATVIDERAHFTDFAHGAFGMNTDTGDIFGQVPQTAPSVFNFFRPTYHPPVIDDTGEEMFVAPAAQLLTSYRIFSMFNRYADWTCDREIFPVGFDRYRTGFMLVNPGPASDSAPDSGILRGQTPDSTTSASTQSTNMLNYLETWMCGGAMRDKGTIQTELSETYYSLGTNTPLRAVRPYTTDAGWYFAIADTDTGSGITENAGHILEIRLADGDVRDALTVGSAPIAAIAFDHLNSVLYAVEKKSGSTAQVPKAFVFGGSSPDTAQSITTSLAPFDADHTIVGMDIFLKYNVYTNPQILCVLSTKVVSSVTETWLHLFNTDTSGSVPSLTALTSTKITGLPSSGFTALDVACTSYNGGGDFWITGNASSTAYGNLFRVPGPKISSGTLPSTALPSTTAATQVGSSSGYGPLVFGQIQDFMLFASRRPASASDSPQFDRLNLTVGSGADTFTSTGATTETRFLQEDGEGLIITDVAGGDGIIIAGKSVADAFRPVNSSGNGAYDRSRRAAAASWLTLISPDFAVQK